MKTEWYTFEITVGNWKKSEEKFKNSWNQIEMGI
jgi:hypothetical protein